LNFGHIDHLATNPSINVPTTMEFVTFASALVRREAFYGVDGFDERYDCYGEDSDICLRMGKVGWKIRYNPHAHAVHQESRTSSPMKEQLLREGNRVFSEIWGGKQ